MSHPSLKLDSACQYLNATLNKLGIHVLLIYLNPLELIRAKYGV